MPKYGRLYLLPAVVVNNNLARVSGTGRIGERKEFARATVSGRDGPLRIARAKLFYQGPISPGRRRDIRCVTAADLLLDLGGQETSRALERRLRAYVKPRLLVVDERGYLTYDNRAADLLFQVINRRYERRSILVTTNLAFKEWGTAAFWAHLETE